MDKGAMESGSSSQGYAKLSPNYHHQGQQHERNPSMDDNMHHHMHQQQQQQHHAKPPLPAHHHASYHPKAYGHYGRGEGTGAGGDYPPYPPPPNHYHPHYAPHSRTTPGVRPAVTHSFSTEEEQREDGSSRYGSGHHRGQSARDAANYLRDEYRSPSSEYHSDRSSEHEMPYNRRDYPYGGRELPPVLEGSESHLQPRGVNRREHNPLERVPSINQEETPVSAIDRSLSSISAGSPLKRSFWHHSRPDQATHTNEEYGSEGPMAQSSSLPSEFMPPKRSKTSPPDSGGSTGSPKRDKEYIVTARSQTSSNPQQQQLLEIARANSDVGSLSGIRTSPGASGLSPRDVWFNRTRSMSWEAREDYYRRDPRSAASWSSRSPSGRDGPAPMSSTSGPHWMGAPYMPSPRSRHEGGHYDAPLQPWEASPREWGHHPHLHHQQPYSPHLPYPAWLGGSKGGDVRQRDDSKFPRPGQDHGGYGIDQQHPGMHFSDRPPQPRGMNPMIGSPMQTSSGVEPTAMMKGQSAEENRGLTKNGPVKLLALPEDRISLSETLCIVREVRDIHRIHKIPMMRIHNRFLF